MYSETPLDLTYRGNRKNNDPQPTNYPITVETGVGFGWEKQINGKKLGSTDKTPYFSPYALGYSMDMKAQDASLKDMKSILPDTSRSDYSRVYIELMLALRENGGANIQSSLIRQFKDAPVQQKMILANTLASLLEDKTYSNVVYAGKSVRTDTFTLYRALQRSINIGENVPAGVCSHIHIAVAQLLSGIGLSSSVMTVAQTGSMHVVSGVDMRREGLGYMILDYGKVYHGRDRMEALQFYEKESGVASIKNYIADKNGKIIGEIQTPIGEEYTRLMHGQSFDQFIENGKMKDGVNITLYLQDGKPVGGIDAIKYLTDNLYVHGTLARSQVPGATVDGARVGLGYHIINNGSSLLTAEVNYGQTRTKWGANGRKSEDHHISGSLQGSTNIIQGENGSIDMFAGANVAFQQNKNASEVRGSTLVPNGGTANVNIGVKGKYNYNNGLKLGGRITREYSPSGNVGNFNSEKDLQRVRLGNTTDTLNVSLEKGNIGATYSQEKNNISKSQSLDLAYKPNDSTTITASYTQKKFDQSLVFSDSATTSIGLRQELSPTSGISVFVQSTKNKVGEILNPQVKGGINFTKSF